MMGDENLETTAANLQRLQLINQKTEPGFDGEYPRPSIDEEYLIGNTSIDGEYPRPSIHGNTLRLVFMGIP